MKAPFAYYFATDAIEMPKPESQATDFCNISYDESSQVKHKGYRMMATQPGYSGRHDTYTSSYGYNGQPNPQGDVNNNDDVGYSDYLSDFANIEA